MIVGIKGEVQSARAVAGLSGFFSSAQRVASVRSYKPFERSGIAVTASFNDEVSIVPPEQWAEANVSFPEIQNMETLKIGLKRTACLAHVPNIL